MTPEQIPDITQDEGIKRDVREFVKNVLALRKSSIADMSKEIEEVAYLCMMQGEQMGFRTGWRLGQQKLISDQKKWKV